MLWGRSPPQHRKSESNCPCKSPSEHLLYGSGNIGRKWSLKPNVLFRQIHFSVGSPGRRGGSAAFEVAPNRRTRRTDGVAWMSSRIRGGKVVNLTRSANGRCREPLRATRPVQTAGPSPFDPPRLPPDPRPRSRSSTQPVPLEKPVLVPLEPCPYPHFVFTPATRASAIFQTIPGTAFFAFPVSPKAKFKEVLV